MAKTSKIEIALGRTVNIGNYESEKFEIRVTKELDPRDDADFVYDDALKVLTERANSLHNEIMVRNGLV